MLKAMGHSVIVQDMVEPEGTTTSSGIFIPKYSSVSQVTKAKVINSNLKDVAVNEIILYLRNTGTTVIYENKEYVVVQMQNIVAKIEE